MNRVEFVPAAGGDVAAIVSIRPIARAASLKEGMCEVEVATGGFNDAPPNCGCERIDSIDPFGPRSMHVIECGRPSSFKHFSMNIDWGVDLKDPMAYRSRFGSWPIMCRASLISAAVNWPGAAIMGRSGCVIGEKTVFKARESCPI